jgi:hypothetical protein
MFSLPTTTTRARRLWTLALVTAIGAASAAPAGAALISERVGGDARATPDGYVGSRADGPMDELREHLASYRIVGRQAESYINQRLDNPDHTLITLRSQFHAGDPE